MGCDIHAYIEFQEYEDKDGNPMYWNWSGRVWFSRNYWLFELMAGVRGDNKLYEPRGIPEHLSWMVQDEYTLRPVPSSSSANEGECTIENAHSWIANGLSEWVNEDHRRITHPDWHTPSWLNVAEMEHVYGEYLKSRHPSEPRVEAIIAAMKALNQNTPDKSRLVFWFDN